MRLPVCLNTYSKPACPGLAYPPISGISGAPWKYFSVFIILFEWILSRNILHYQEMIQPFNPGWVFAVSSGMTADDFKAGTSNQKKVNTMSILHCYESSRIAQQLFILKGPKPWHSCISSAGMSSSQSLQTPNEMRGERSYL